MQTTTLENAVAKISDGATLMIGGFMGVGTPESVVDELVSQGRRDLTVIARTSSSRRNPRFILPGLALAVELTLMARSDCNGRGRRTCGLRFSAS